MSSELSLSSLPARVPSLPAIKVIFPSIDLKRSGDFKESTVSKRRRIDNPNQIALKSIEWAEKAPARSIADLEARVIPIECIEDPWGSLLAAVDDVVQSNPTFENIFNEEYDMDFPWRTERSALLPLWPSEVKSSSSQEVSDNEPLTVWEAALEEATATNGRNVAPLLNFLQAKDCNLQLAAIDEIFNYIINKESAEDKEHISASDNKALLLASIELNLPMSNRVELLNYGSKKKDFEIIRAAIEGKAGQEPFNFLEWEKWVSSGPFYTIADLKEQGHDSATISYFLSHSVFEKEDFEEIEKRLYLSNMWGLDEGYFEIKGVDIPYEGGLPYLFEEIKEGVLAFKKEFPRLFKVALIKELCEMLEGSKQTVPLEKRLERYQQEKPIMLFAGSKEHQKVAYLNQWVLAMVDRGNISVKPITFHTIAPEFVTEKCLKTIMKSNLKFDNPQSETFFGKTLPEMLNGINGSNTHDPLNKVFTDNWVGSLWLETGTCVPDSICTTLIGSVALHALFNNKYNYQVVPGALEKAQVLITYLLFHSAEHYLKVSSANPKAMDRLLFERVLEKAKDKAAKAPSKASWQKKAKAVWNRKAKALEEAFKAL